MAAVEEQNTIETPTALEQKIIKQIEYYFGDQNVARDKFLRGKMQEDSGWVGLECLVTFNRLKTLSADFDVIKTALRKSTAGLIQVNVEDNKIRRTADLPIPDLQDPEFRHEAKLRTVYMKGFPTTHSIDDIESFLADKGKVLFIKMRRADDRSFKGSIFVEFDSEATAKAVIAIPDLKINDSELTVMLRDVYYQMKSNEKKQAKAVGGTEQNTNTKEEQGFQAGCFLHFKGVGEGTSREDLKDLFRAHANLGWVNFARDDTEGYIHFHGEGSAQKAIDGVKSLNDGKVMIKGVEAEVRVLEGEEETTYRQQAIQDRKDAITKKDAKSNQRRSAKKGGGGRKNRKPWQTRNDESTTKNGDNDDGDDKSKADHQRFEETDDATPAAGTKRPATDDAEPKQGENDAKVSKVESEPKQGEPDAKVSKVESED